MAARVGAVHRVSHANRDRGDGGSIGHVGFCQGGNEVIGPQVTIEPGVVDEISKIVVVDECVLEDLAVDTRNEKTIRPSATALE